MEFDPVLFAKAISDETRQKIMQICCCASLSVTAIVEKLDVSQPTVSHHLAILREAGLVTTREEGKQTFYSLNQERVRSAAASSWYVSPQRPPPRRTP